MNSNNGILFDAFNTNPKNLLDTINETSPRDNNFKLAELYNSIQGLLSDNNIKNVVQGSEFSKIKSFLAKINPTVGDDDSLNKLSSIYSFLKSGLVLDEMKKSDGVFLKKISGILDEDGSVAGSSGSSKKNNALESYVSKISSEYTDYFEKADLVNSLYVSWVQKVNDTKNKLKEIYKDRINTSSKSSYSKFNSPDTVLKVNKIIGDMNSFHSMISNTFSKIFSTMSNIVGRMI